jgi:cytochrome d ubiquinol oxidase subunit I
VEVPGVLSVLAFGHFYSDVRGLDAFPEGDWPDNIALLYYAFHVMAGLCTILVGIMLRRPFSPGPGGSKRTVRC